MLSNGQQAFTIAHSSDISSARRYAAQLSSSLGFGEVQAGRLAIIVTEAATNILKHAGDGLMLVTPVSDGGGQSIEVLALDRGKGIANLGESLSDGVSTSGTQGTGLGAIRRLSRTFDVYSAPGKGSAFYAAIDHVEAEAAPARGARPARPVEHAAICIPIAGEDECGDAWAVEIDDTGVTMMVADGLGHGPEAARASNAAVQEVKSRPGQAPAVVMEHIHKALRPTRGAAVAVARYSLGSAELVFGGIGNIAAAVLGPESRKQMVSHNGIVGHNMRKVQEFPAPWPQEAVYIMCSDGITTQWDIAGYPGLFARHPAVIAGVIYRDFSRGRDDATVLVVKRNA
jgi:anti-sigma regulatory factor (Ser/Thr protein kinase)